MIKENQKLLNLSQLLVDAIIIAFSFLLAYNLRFDDTWSPLIKHQIIEPPRGYWRNPEDYQTMLVLLIPCYLILYRLFGMYDPKRTAGRRSELWGLLKANTFGLIYCVAVLYLIKEPDFARLFLIIFAGINLIIDYIFRLSVMRILRKMRRSGLNLKHIILVGYSRTAEGYIDRLRSHPEWGYKVHGILDDRREIGESYRKIDIIGKISTLEQILATNEYDEIAITLSIDEYSKLEQIVAICEKSGVHTKFIPDYNHIIPTKPYTEDLDGLPVIHVRHVPLSSSFNNTIKRLVDVFGSLVAITIFSIPMLIVACIVKFTSPGPLIFKQTRIGLHNREFQMYKFRSMRVQNEADEKKAWTTQDDPRVTPIGKFMRKTNVDELPQLFNVLVGDMSFVGPRPEREEITREYEQSIPQFRFRLKVKAGLTGYAQVYGQYNTVPYDKLKLDLTYIENYSLWLDLKLILLTVKILFQKEKSEGVDDSQKTALKADAARQQEQAGK